MRYRTLFTVGTSLDGVVVDTFYPVDMEALAVLRVKARLTGEPDEGLDRVAHNYRALMLRARLGAQYGGVHSVHTDESITMDELEALLRAKQREGTLREFLDKARI